MKVIIPLNLSKQLLFQLLFILKKWEFLLDYFVIIISPLCKMALYETRVMQNFDTIIVTDSNHSRINKIKQ
jgi:hypothetical protein